jgi:hypothetical protein
LSRKAAAFAWLCIEGTAGDIAGIVAGSIAALGFGLDSAIEGIASVIRLGSSATSGEGRQNLLCCYLAGAVLVGLLGNTWFGIWWLDPIAALVIASVAVVEGRKAWNGESCDCAGCCRLSHAPYSSRIHELSS